MPDDGYEINGEISDGFTADPPFKVEVNAATAEDIIERSAKTISELRAQVLRLQATVNDYSAELDAYYQEFGPLSER